MEIIYLLIGISVIFLGVIIYWFFWAVGDGQFDDLERESHRILMDDDAVSDHDANADHVVESDQSIDSDRQNK